MASQAVVLRVPHLVSVHMPTSRLEPVAARSQGRAAARCLVQPHHRYSLSTTKTLSLLWALPLPQSLGSDTTENGVLITRIPRDRTALQMSSACHLHQLLQLRFERA